jgi:hypothetical protein
MAKAAGPRKRTVIGRSVFIALVIPEMGKYTCTKRDFLVCAFELGEYIRGRMQLPADIVVSFGVILDGGEFILVIALVIILVGGRGLGRGIGRFGGELRDGLDREAREAGKSVGGIYGRPAAEALTSDNQTAELYDPAVFGERGSSKKPNWKGLWRRVRLFVAELVNRFLRKF